MARRKGRCRSSTDHVKGQPGQTSIDEQGGFWGKRPKFKRTSGYGKEGRIQSKPGKTFERRNHRARELELEYGARTSPGKSAGSKVGGKITFEV